MKMPHLLRVTAPAAAFAELADAVRAAGLRFGWLDLEAAPVPPPELTEASKLAPLRAVAVGGGRAVAVKPITGPPVLRDLLREHFRGCRLVLCRGGDLELPRLEPEAGGWRVELPGGAARRRGTEELVADLRKPDPWGQR